MNQNKLSADPLALILGIVALVIGIAGCCCYGITAIIPLIIGIIGLVSANKSLREYGENPEAYSPQSRSNVNTAKIINIIAVIMNSIIVLFAIIAIAFYGTMLSSGMLNEIRNNSTTHDYYDSSDDYEKDIDTTTLEDDNYIIEEEDAVGIEESEIKEE